MKLFALLFAFVGLLSCKTSQISDTPAPKAGMFKIAILYPNGEGKTFDMDYYEKKHMPMVAGFLGKNLKFYEIDKGVTEKATNDKALYVAVGYFYIRDTAEFNKAIGQHWDAVGGDIKNYTNIQPIVYKSEVKQVIHNSVKHK